MDQSIVLRVIVLFALLTWFRYYMVKLHLIPSHVAL